MKDVSYYKYRPSASLQVTDEDAADFLQSQFSGNLYPIEAGRSVYGLWLDVKGKVIGDSQVLCRGEDSFLVISELSSGDTIQAQLEHHIIADDVAIEPADVAAAFTVIGGVDAGFWEALSIISPQTGYFTETQDLVVFTSRRGLATAFEVVCKNSAGEVLLNQQLEQFALTKVSFDALQPERIAAGIPLIPQEIGPGDLPGEGGLVQKGALALDKGCYLGQEVVARMHNLGRPQRALFSVCGKVAVPTVPMEVKNADGKIVGELRSAFLDSSANTWFGVALLKTRYVKVGATLFSESGDLSVDTLI